MLVKSKWIPLFLGFVLTALTCGNAAEAKEPSLKIPAASVSVSGNESWREEEILKLLPALSSRPVDVRRLSEEIQLVNDAGALELAADFQKQEDGSFHVVVHVKEEKPRALSLNLNNTGNQYTGDWRLNATYTHASLTGHSDNLGAAWVTSPGHWEDVKQGALLYRRLFPGKGDSAYFSYSYSDVDLGRIADFSGLGINATGRGSTVGAHYQHNIRYTKAHRQLVDFGFDYKDYRNAQDFRLTGYDSLHNEVDFSVFTGSISFLDIRRWNGRYLAWSAGYTGNIDGNKEKMNRYRFGSDRHFDLFTASFNAQQRVGNDWILGLRMNGQYTKNDVVSTEQLGAGGMYTVRGFKERSVSGDCGYVGSFEIYTPSLAGHSRFVFFTDFAGLMNHHHYNNEFSHETLGSIGLGYRYYNEKNKLSISLDYAKVIDDIEKDTENNRRPWNVSITKQF